MAEPKIRRNILYMKRLLLINAPKGIYIKQGSIHGILVSKPWAEPELTLASYPSVFTRTYYDDLLYMLIWDKKNGCGINIFIRHACFSPISISVTKT